MNTYDLIIIGGGAAGVFASLNSKHKRILIIERNTSLMKKLMITGKGRCNLTNNCDVETVLLNIPRNSAFMRGALSRFTPHDTIAFFEEIGVPLKTERGGRVFPISDKSGDVVNALKKHLNAEIVTDRARELIIESVPVGATCGRPQMVTGVKCETATYYSKNVLISTGGMSYPKTGSTGDGYEMARKVGHSITPLKPSLIPLETVEDCSSVMGLSLKNVRLTLLKNNKAVFSEQGEMLFTHFGVSGPLVLSASSYISELSTIHYQLSIDFKPALDEKKLDTRILRDFNENKNKQFKNSLNALLPEKLIELFITRSKIPPDKRVNEITRQERERLISLFKDFRLTVKSFRPIEEAVITDGGISVKEIDPKTMQSKLVKGLYFAGEIIDVTGFTGGFNLQIAFSTAYTAISSIDFSLNP
ncbi:MAG: NAD(P)/FAD-dependent oxidoreductase [Oscillospiraceae bacterium]|nr:NAD(P)/FAD-dependent oxidoreductase [Oscillospiraceae bacterium]